MLGQWYYKAKQWFNKFKKLILTVAIVKYTITIVVMVILYFISRKWRGKNWRGGFRVYSCFFRLLLCYFVRYFPTFFFNNFWLLVLILCKSFLCLSRANVDGKFLNDFGGSLHLEHCSRFNPHDGISGYFISLPIVLSNSQTCWQIVQYLPRAKWLGNFFILVLD